MRREHRLCWILALAVIFSAPLAAEIFTVTLDNGATFETRYAPLEDPTDSTKLQFLTDTGNWVSMPAAIVKSVAADTETRGFGRVIASNTIEIGMSFNDLAVPEEGGGPADSTQALVNYFREQDAQQQDYSVQQFVEPEQAGQGGLPVIWATRPR
jgi:hypothetical protein